MRLTHRGIRTKYRVRSGVLHAVEENVATITRVCRKLPAKGALVFVARLDKWDGTGLIPQHDVYNRSVAALLREIAQSGHIEPREPIEVLVERRETSAFLNKRFVDYVISHVRHSANIVVHLRSPHEEKGLQIADLAAWACFRQYERHDGSFRRLLRPI